MAINKRPHTVTQEIIDMLVEASDLTIEWINNPYKQYRRIRGVMEPEEWNRIFREKKKRRVLKELKRKKWLTERREGNQIVYELEASVAIRRLKTAIRSKVAFLPEPSIVLVAFDFPEAARKARDSFRYFLKSAGFAKKQLSVWFTNKSVLDEIQALVRMLNLEKWVNVFLTHGT
ncbi:CRISPR-associated endonuclease Cas2 [Candidatus Uhrbacteria bacterium]|nr:CRISPR-associated endonuclease Cas2 [Candidatus Uhrbacteria bacterium]